MEIIRGYMEARGDAGKIVGTVAGGIVPHKVLEYALNKWFRDNGRDATEHLDRYHTHKRSLNYYMLFIPFRCILKI